MDTGFPYLDQIVTELSTTDGTQFHDALDDRAWPQRTPVEVLTAATKDLSTDESGTLFIFSRAAGIAVALPAITATEVGVTYSFYTGTTFSGGSGVITAQTGDLLIGHVIQYDSDTSNAVAFRAPDGSDDLITTLNGTTQGGIAGTLLTFTATTANQWLVTGVAIATGAVATPFS